MIPTLEKAAGKENVHLIKAVTPAEDFSYFQKEIPGFYIGLGGMKPDADPSEVAFHHTPDFYVDDSGMILGMKAMATLTLDYMSNQ